MKLLTTSLPEVVIVEPEVHEDARGSLFESFNQAEFEAALNVNRRWVQDNQSWSKPRVLRGLHYQIVRPQGKLVRCPRGSIFDVAVDLRRSSDTFGRWAAANLSEENRRQMWIPEGFAHGFVVTSEGASVQYKTTDYYQPDGARAIRWNDPQIGIAWPSEGAPILSQKDETAPFLTGADVYD